MLASAEAGIAYFVIAYLCGFVLGAVRVLLVAPRLGQTIAVLLETPIILGICWLACAWCTEFFRVPKSLLAESVMGATAFILLLIGDFCVATLIFNQAAGGYFQAFWSIPRAIGLAAQIVFACFPILQHDRSYVSTPIRN